MPWTQSFLAIYNGFTSTPSRGFGCTESKFDSCPEGLFSMLSYLSVYQHIVIVTMFANIVLYNQQHSNNDADDDLPSVMTCANYLKLPAYCSKVWTSYLSAI
jgi:hypothetical protein